MSSSNSGGGGGEHRDGFDLIQRRIESLSSKMDKLINIQEKVLNRLDGMSQDIDGIEKDMETLKVDKEEIHLPARLVAPPPPQGPGPAAGAGTGPELSQICREMSSVMSAVNRRSEMQAQKLEGMEKLVLSMQQVIGFIGETVKSSRLMELVFRGAAVAAAARRSPRSKEGRRAARRKPSADAISKKPDKKTTSNKASKTRNQQITPVCEPSRQQPSDRIKLHGPKHFLSSRKCGHFLKEHKGRDAADKPCLSPKPPRPPKKIKPPPDAAEHVSLKKQVLLLEEVQKLNRENAEKSAEQLKGQDAETSAPPAAQPPQTAGGNLVEYLRDDTKESAQERPTSHGKQEPQPTDTQKVQVVVHEEDVKEKVQEEKKEEEVDKPSELPAAQEQRKQPPASGEDHNEAPPAPQPEHKPSAAGQPAASQEDDKDRLIADQVKEEEEEVKEEDKEEKDKDKEEDKVKEVDKVKEEDKEEEEEKEEEKQEEKEEEEEEEEEPRLRPEGWAVFKAEGVEIQLDLKERVERERQEMEAEQQAAMRGRDQDRDQDQDRDRDQDDAERFFIDTSPPPAAPFNHRIVSAKPNQICNFYTINWQEVLGGGRFGQVHKCVENSSGLTLAAKVIKARAQKEKDVVKNEIQVMNALDHANLIQLYAAYESRNDIILVLEYVGGGELFDRIIDENYTLMELDAVVFIRQICEGLQHMHKMYVLHLDLKPENILCVSRATNKIKIIDFGLARIYKPREKLRVNFGTPEFLAPEVINYDFVSFNTDMWSLGVITYMLLSGLCPFLGDDDNQTLNNILACQWNFDEQEFVDTSPQAKDFISRLLVINKSWRMGAAEALRHPWLSDTLLHHRLHTKKTMCRSRRSSCVPTDS